MEVIIGFNAATDGGGGGDDGGNEMLFSVSIKLVISQL